MQLRAFELAGVGFVVEEKKSGVKARPELNRLLSILRPGDELIVWRLDRLARSLVDLLLILRAVERAGAGFRSLTEPVETVTPAGRMVVQMLAAFAEYERALIVERATAGMRAARARGVRFGAPPGAGGAAARGRHVHGSGPANVLCSGDGVSTGEVRRSTWNQL